MSSLTSLFTTSPESSVKSSKKSPQKKSPKKSIQKSPKNSPKKTTPETKRKYARNSPETPAKTLTEGIVMNGRDGKKWIIKAGSKGNRWARVPEKKTPKTQK